MSKAQQIMSEHAKFGVKEQLCISAVAVHMTVGFKSAADVIRAITTNGDSQKIMARLLLTVPRPILISTGLVLIEATQGVEVPEGLAIILERFAEVTTDASTEENLAKLDVPLSDAEKAYVQELYTPTESEPDATGFSLKVPKTSKSYMN